MASMTIIPQDIITTHILCRLPAKSIGRFCCVSKEWLSLLSESRFIQTHQKTLNINRFIFESNYGSLYSVPYNYHEAVPTLTKLCLGFNQIQIDYIHGSVNGLVLALAYRNLHKDYTLFVLNPTTKEYAELPISRQTHFSGMKGFGYDSVSGDYKVVIISCFGKSYGNVVVYNLRTNTWKKVSHSLYDNSHKNWFSGVFVNGFLYWIFNSHSKAIIVAFSLADENFSELPSPSLYSEVDIKYALSETKLVALGEKLAIFHEVKGDVWLMNEYGVQKSWTKIVVHGFNEIPMIRPKIFYDNGKILFLTCELLSIYDVEKGIFCKSAHISYMNLNRVMGAYVESLVSPKFSKSN